MPKARKKNRDSVFERQMWTRRFVAEEPRLSEAVELYKSLGYEVRLEPAVLDETNEECKRCLTPQNLDKYKTIYVRPKKKK